VRLKTYHHPALVVRALAYDTRCWWFSFAVRADVTSLASACATQIVAAARPPINNPPPLPPPSPSLPACGMHACLPVPACLPCCYRVDLLHRSVLPCSSSRSLLCVSYVRWWSLVVGRWSLVVGRCWWLVVVLDYGELCCAGRRRLSVIASVRACYDKLASDVPPRAGARAY